MSKIRENGRTIRGVRLVDVAVFHDERGELVAFEDRAGLPFVLRRVSYLKVDNPTTVRANHATSSDVLVAPVLGSVIVDVDNGYERSSIRLDTPERGVWARPGIFVRLRGFSRQAVLLVCASKPFEDTRYFGAPQPDLIDAKVWA